MIPHGALKCSATYFIKSNSILKLNSKEKNRGTNASRLESAYGFIIGGIQGLFDYFRLPFRRLVGVR